MANSNISRDLYASFLNIDNTVNRLREMQAEKMSEKTKDIGYSSEAKLLTHIAVNLVTTVETIDRVKSKLEASLAVEEAKQITKNGSKEASTASTASTASSEAPQSEESEAPQVETGETVTA
jgi:hypothetical protein